jgi:hypothetical protein
MSAGTRASASSAASSRTPGDRNASRSTLLKTPCDDPSAPDLDELGTGGKRPRVAITAPTRWSSARQSTNHTSARSAAAIPYSAAIRSNAEASCSDNSTATAASPTAPHSARTALTTTQASWTPRPELWSSDNTARTTS